ncbi:hypothetical protein GCM10027051_04080 [Niabella terrae]
MENNIKSRLRKTTTIFWLLLIYIVAALIWWFISLEKQNDQLYTAYREQLTTLTVNDSTADLANARMGQLTRNYNMNRFKYAGEGIVFLIVMLVGAVFIIRSVRQQIKMQQQQQNFMMAVTHELKTPIAVTRLNLETLLKHRLEEQQQKKLLERTLDEASRLNFLTNNILVSSQLEGSAYQMNFEDLDLSNLLQDRIEEFKKRFPSRNFQINAEEDADVRGDAFLLQILINNLLENAIKYSEKDQPVHALLKKEGGRVVLSVIDEGKGIPAEEKQRIFSKFYRIGNEATRTKQGTGLGLYLVKKIAEDHNADISVTDNTPTGSIFAISF